MRIAIVGCGFVADFYLKTLPLHPALELVGVMDRDADRAARFAAYYSVPTYRTMDDLLADPRVQMVVNLTNPRSHYEVSKACLEAGKHVYTEKPMAMSFSNAQALELLAAQRGLYIASAPSRHLGETAQTLWKALREKAIGTVRLAYAELDDGLVHRMPYKTWVSQSGAPWPYKDEFEIGCILEHAGYLVSWLLMFFGPAQPVTAFSSCLIPDKATDVPVTVEAPDFSVACIKFASGPVARLTCSIIAPADHSLRIFGDDGVLSTDDCWLARSPVYIKRRLRIGGKTFMAPWKKRLPLVRMPNAQTRHHGLKKVDFCLGVAELAAAIEEQRPCRLSSSFCVHVNEIVLAIHNALETGSPYKITSSFEPIDPMPWATGWVQ